MQKRDNKGRFTRGQQTVKGYKGFHAGMVCRGKQYNENTVERVEGAPVLCENGIHFCENPFDVLNYYPLVDDYGMPNEFAEVEALGSCVSDGVKTTTSRIRIGKKLGLSGFCHASCEYLERLCVAGADTTGSNRQQSQSGTGSQQSQSGDYSQQSQSGDYSQQSQSGDYSQQSQSGDYSQQSQSGDYSQQSQSGDYSQQSQSGTGSQQSQSGNGSRQSQSGYRSQQSQSGYRSRQSQSGYGSRQSQSGDCSQQSQSGTGSQQSQSGYGSRQAAVGNACTAVAVAEDCLVAVLGPGGRVRGALGCVLVLAQYREGKDGIAVVDCVVSAKVDGEKIKPNTWYILRDGIFTEDQNDSEA